MFIATFAFGWMNILAKNLNNFNPFEVVFFRAFGTFIFIFPYMLAKRISVLGKNKKILFFRGLLGFISLATFFIAVQHIPLGAAISIRYIGPILGILLAYIFLKEHINRLQWFGFLVVLAGVFLLKGFDLRIDLFGFAMALISALLFGIIILMISYLGDKEHYLTIVNYFMVFSIVGSLFFVNYWQMPNGIEWFYVSAIGVFGLIGQVFMTKAFQLAETNIIVPFKYMELIYGLIFGYVLFGENFSFLSFMGMGLIVFGLIWNIYVKTGKR